MERGDLSASAPPRITVVLEGVLADITVTETGRWKKRVDTTVEWRELPLKSIQQLKSRFPEVSIDVVTFLGQDVLERAADFFGRAGIMVNSIYTEDFDQWTWSLRFRHDIVTIYDSDMDRLMKYGQKGVSVVKGSPL